MGTPEAIAESFCQTLAQAFGQGGAGLATLGSLYSDGSAGAASVLCLDGTAYPTLPAIADLYRQRVRAAARQRGRSFAPGRAQLLATLARARCHVRAALRPRAPRSFARRAARLGRRQSPLPRAARRAVLARAPVRGAARAARAAPARAQRRLTRPCAFFCARAPRDCAGCCCWRRARARSRPAVFRRCTCSSRRRRAPCLCAPRCCALGRARGEGPSSARRPPPPRCGC